MRRERSRIRSRASRGLLIPNPAKDATKGAAIKDFLYWMLDHGESEAAGMTYAPLPKAVSDRVRTTIGTLK